MCPSLFCRIADSVRNLSTSAYVSLKNLHEQEVAVVSCLPSLEQFGAHNPLRAALPEVVLLSAPGTARLYLARLLCQSQLQLLHRTILSSNLRGCLIFPTLTQVVFDRRSHMRRLLEHHVLGSSELHDSPRQKPPIMAPLLTPGFSLKMSLGTYSTRAYGSNPRRTSTRLRCFGNSICSLHRMAQLHGRFQRSYVTLLVTSFEACLGGKYAAV